MIRKIFAISGFALAILISAICEINISGKHYFSLAFTAAFLLYLAGEFIYNYVLFRKSYKEKYKVFKVKIINSTNISMERIEIENKKYYRQFKQSMLKESILKMFYVFVSVGFSIAVIVAIFI